MDLRFIFLKLRVTFFLKLRFIFLKLVTLSWTIKFMQIFLSSFPRFWCSFRHRWPVSLRKLTQVELNCHGHGSWAQTWVTQWGQVTHICASKLTITGSDNGLSPGRHQAITWTNARILLIGPLGRNFNEILIEIYTFSFRKLHLKTVVWKTAAILSRPQCVNFLSKISHRPQAWWE